MVPTAYYSLYLRAMCSPAHIVNIWRSTGARGNVESLIATQNHLPRQPVPRRDHHFLVNGLMTVVGQRPRGRWPYTAARTSAAREATCRDRPDWLQRRHRTRRGR